MGQFYTCFEYNSLIFISSKKKKYSQRKSYFVLNEPSSFSSHPNLWDNFMKREITCHNCYITSRQRLYPESVHAPMGWYWVKISIYKHMTGDLYRAVIDTTWPWRLKCTGVAQSRLSLVPQLTTSTIICAVLFCVMCVSLCVVCYCSTPATGYKPFCS
jgi:hypothetical protein